MRTDRVIDVVETHTEGQVVRTVTGGIDTTRMTTDDDTGLIEAFDDAYGWLRDFLAKEPRGHRNLVVSVPVPSREADADVGYVFFDNSVYLENCGDAVIGSTTALIETGMLEPRTTVTAEVPAGLVETNVRLDADDRVEEVAIRGMESYHYGETTTTISTDAGPTDVPVDVAYGGNWFAFVDAADLGLSLDHETAESDRIVDYGVRIRDRLNGEFDVVDPLTGETEPITITMFVDRSEPVDRGVIVYAAGSIGRSPCGTGTAAQLARLHEQGELDVGDTHPVDSLIDTRFTGRILDVETRGETTVTTCEVAGSASIVAKNTYYRDPTDGLDSFSL